MNKFFYYYNSDKYSTLLCLRLFNHCLNINKNKVTKKTNYVYYKLHWRT